MVDVGSPRVTARAGDAFRRPSAAERAARRLTAWVTTPAIRGALQRMYAGVLTIATRGRGLTSTLPGGEVVRVLPAFRFLTWNATEYDAFRAVVKPGMTAFDIGANVGSYTLLLAQWVGREGHVYAFEPSATPFEGLRRHVDINGVSAVATPIASAVGATTGTLPFVVASTPGESRLAPAHGSAAATAVPVTTIDAFCARHGVTPDFIKVDVEGSELDVLRGARQTIARTAGRLALFVELHPSLWRERGISRADVEEELDRLNLSVVGFEPHADPWTLEGVCVRLVPRH